MNLLCLPSVARTLRSAVESTLPPPNIKREVENGVVTLSFDRLGSSANVFDEATLKELDAHLSWIEQSSGLRGVVLASAKEGIFIAGADLKSLATADSARITHLLELGQAVFGRLARLQLPKVALIHGACLGGGFELALACDWRVASLDKATQIGLPEVQLGVIPGWGGTTRLPRLIGLAKALPMLMEGKPLNARKAAKLGVIDAAVPREEFAKAVREFLSKGLRPPAWNFWTNNRLSAYLIRRRVRAAALEKTRGLYPAPLAALETAVQGLRLPMTGSLKLEQEAFLKLCGTPVSHNLMRAFFLTERAKKSGSSVVVSAPPITRAAVVGAGVMGAGISQWLASRGIEVLLHDVSPERVSAGLKTAADLFKDAVARGLMDSKAAAASKELIVPVSFRSNLANLDLVIEAAVEDLTLKRKIFRDLESRTRSDTILATNTSALSIGAIAEGLAHPERVVGMHFFNPVSRMKLVEIASWPGVSEDVVRRVLQFTGKIGKLPVLVQDSPGFIVNRILMPYLLEAVRLFDHGADAALIDQAMLDFGMPMGPLRLLDEIGLDVAHHVAKTLAEAMPGRIEISPIIVHLLEAGQLGKKSGHGFYHHAGDGKTLKVDPMALSCRQTQEPMHIDPASVRDRLVMLMVNEAAYCVLEGVAQSPEDVDFAMLMGTGFAPLHGGPLRFADAMGLPHFVRKLEAAAAATQDAIFAPCPLLVEKMVRQERFYPVDG